MELAKSSVHRGLDVQMRVGGFEAFDLIVVLIFGAFLSLLQLPGVVAIGIPALALIGLYFGKRGKPEGYLIHFFRYYLTPGHYAAGETYQEIIEKRTMYDR